MTARFELRVGGCTVRAETLSDAWDGPVRGLAASWADQPCGPIAGSVVYGSGAPGLDVGSAIVGLVEATRVTVDGTPPAVAVDHALPLTLAWLLANCDRWVVHGAAVRPPGADGAVVAIGAAGAGKSTTAAAALTAGWPVIADDLLIVRWVDGVPMVAGVPRPLAVPPDVGARLGRPIDADPRGRVGVPARLAPGWCPVSALVVLAHGAQPATEVCPVPAVDALRALTLAHFPAAIDGRIRRWFPAAARLARLPAWRLLLGADPGERLATTSACLGEVIATRSIP